MLETSKRRDANKGRFGTSLVVALGIFGAASIAMSAAVSSAKGRMREREVAVEFSPEPEAEEVEETPPEPKPRPKVKRKKKERQDVVRAEAPDVSTVSEIPDEVPDEQEGELSDSGDVGPVDGMVDGQSAPDAPEKPEGGPRIVREKVRSPRLLSGCRGPQAPKSLMKSAERVDLRVSFVVSRQGKPENISVLESHPSLSEEKIIECVRSQRYSPATLPGNLRLRFPHVLRFSFRPDAK